LGRNCRAFLLAVDTRHRDTAPQYSIAIQHRNIAPQPTPRHYNRPECPGPRGRRARQGRRNTYFSSSERNRKRPSKHPCPSDATNTYQRSGMGGGGRTRRRAGRSEPSAKAARRGERARRCGFGAQGAEPAPRSKAGPRRPARVNKPGSATACKRPASSRTQHTSLMTERSPNQLCRLRWCRPSPCFSCQIPSRPKTPSPHLKIFSPADSRP